jgi:hypothetical protein
MNCGRDSFHGSCRRLSILPRFFGFNPSSWAICTWVADSRCRRWASAHACPWAAMVFFFGMFRPQYCVTCG